MVIYTKGQDDFDEAIKLDPENSDAYISRAILLMEISGDMENKNALKDWIKVLELNDSVPKEIKSELERMIQDYYSTNIDTLDITIDEIFD